MGRKRIYKINESYFEKINSQEKAYWLGFIYADGHVTEQSINISLQVKDINHLQKFLVSINSSHPITTYVIRDKKYCRISISNVKFCRNLKIRNWIQKYRKSGIIT